MKPERTPPPPQGPQSSRSSANSGLSAGQIRYRSRSRSRAHEQSQKDGPVKRPPLPDHPLIPTVEPAFVDNQADFANLIEHLRAAGSFAYDTEFIGELSYYPHLCVIQVATTEQVALVDPLAELDLSDFWTLVADEAVETIVHAGVQDLEPVFRYTGRAPLNVFDTQMAIGFVALPHPLSLSESVRLLLGAKLSKGSTFTQWDRRPLSQQQLHYAADDVRFLPALRAEVGERLEAAGHTEWANDEFSLLSDPAMYRFDPLVQCRRIRGARRLAPKQLAALAAAVQWRDDLARERGIPARSLVKDDALRTIAGRSIRTREGLRKAGVLSRPLEADHGQTIVDAVAAAMARDSKDLPDLRQPEETGTQRQEIDGLWALVQAYCFGRGVHPSLVAGRPDIAAIQLADDPEQLPADSRLGRGWRKELLGDLLPRLLAGEAGIRLDWTDRMLRAGEAQR